MAEPFAADPHRRMEFVMQAGQTLLENGGEVYRVQQTMYIMAHTLALPDFNVYVLTNGIFASAGLAELSAVHHIPNRGMNLGRVAAVNELSRRLASGGITTLDEAERQLADIRALPESPSSAQILSAGAGAACFCLLFGGSAADGAAAAFAGLLLAVLMLHMTERHFSSLFCKLVGSATATAICMVLAQLLPVIRHPAATIGVLMVLTPGVAFTTGVGDLLHGDYLSGSIRLLDALISGGAIACGVGLVYGVAHLLGGVF